MHVPAVPYAALRDTAPGRTTAEMAADVLAAREIQAARFAGDAARAPARAPAPDAARDAAHVAARRARLNASIAPGELREHCTLAESSERLLERAMETGRLSARGVGRVLRVARTVADLAGVGRLADEHVLEALRWRAG